MKKTTKQILKKAATYGAVYTLGVATVAALWWATYVPPQDRVCGGPVPYYVEAKGEKLYGYDLCREISTAHAYLHEPIYMFQRQRGIKILEGLAAKGIIDSMNDLARYYQRTNDMDKAVYWVRLAAQHGSPAMLARYLSNHPETLAAEDVKMLEGFALRHSGAAMDLVHYYKSTSPEQSQKWLNHYKTSKDFLPLPADRVVTLKQMTYPYQ